MTRTLAQGNLPYLVTFLEGYTDDTAHPAPLLLFLHGGDRSNTRYYPRKYAQGEHIDFPFVVVAPHCTDGCSWASVDFDALLKEVMALYNIDPARIYVTGYSMEGYGTWDLLARSPDWFAAAAPIAGGGEPDAISKARAVALRAYHGDQDNVIPHTRSQQMIDALQACGADAELVIYPGVKHGSWIPTFKDPAFYQWLLVHRREP